MGNIYMLNVYIFLNDNNLSIFYMPLKILKSKDRKRFTKGLSMAHDDHLREIVRNYIPLFAFPIDMCEKNILLKFLLGFYFFFKQEKIGWIR